MDSNARVRAAEELMSDFAARTGLAGDRDACTRYLWTDAFGVFCFLALHRLTGKPTHLDSALRLVAQVHDVLGRHRENDDRTGWISGLSASEGERHPTRGGLRIGKRLDERRPGEPYDERLEWNRDGQYFHYLTKWMHALQRVTLATGDPACNDCALELAEHAHRAFTCDVPGGGRGIHWKMSIDLSRPLVHSMGQFDALDGFVTYRLLQATRAMTASSAGPELERQSADLGAMCDGRTWMTSDVLGIGGLLADTAHLIRLIAVGAMDHTPILNDMVRDVQQTLRGFAAHNHLDDPAETRLAFRECGLSIGLRAVGSMRNDLVEHGERFHDCGALLTRVDAIERYTPIAECLEHFWLDPEHQKVGTWAHHSEINTVMLATSLVPHVYLLGASAWPAGGSHLQPSAHAERC